MHWRKSQHIYVEIRHDFAVVQLPLKPCVQSLHVHCFTPITAELNPFVWFAISIRDYYIYMCIHTWWKPNHWLIHLRVNVQLMYCCYCSTLLFCIMHLPPWMFFYWYKQLQLLLELCVALEIILDISTVNNFEMETVELDTEPGKCDNQNLMEAEFARLP